MFNSLLLLEKCDDNTEPTVIEQFPPQLDMSADIAIMKACAFQSTCRGYNGVHVFNTENFYGHAWTFNFENRFYSIIIATISFRPALYTKFLQAVKQSFENDTSTDPEARMGLVKSLIESWNYDSTDKLVVNFPYQTFTVDLAHTSNWTEEYDISPLSSLIEHLWKALISNSGVLIVGANAEICSNALLAALSIIEPLRYMDKMLIYTNRNDPRFKEILDGSSEYKLVATTEQFFPQKTQFHVVVRIPSGAFTPTPELQTQYQERTVRFFAIAMGAMNQSLLVNPYFDLLERPIDNIQRYTQNSPLFDRRFFEKVEKTETFRRWRSRKRMRDQLRGAFLSVPPKDAVAFVKDEELLKAKEELERIYNSSEGDEHFRIILGMNRKLVDKRIRSLAQK